MAIRFDDRIETNVAGDVLITGEQIGIDPDNNTIRIGSDETYSIYINSYAYNFLRTSTKVNNLNELAKAIVKVDNDIYKLTTNVVKPAIEELSKKTLTIKTNERFFGDNN